MLASKTKNKREDVDLSPISIILDMYLLFQRLKAESAYVGKTHVRVPPPSTAKYFLTAVTLTKVSVVGF